MHHTYSKWLSVVPFLSFQTKAPKGSLEHFLGGEEYKAFVMMLAARIKPASYAPMEVVLRVNQLCDTL